MDILTTLSFMALALAIFTIGIPYIPQNILYRTFFNKRLRTDRDIAIMRTFLGMMGLMGLLGFIVLFVFAVGDLISTPIAILIVEYFKLNPPKLIMPFISGMLIFLIIVLLIFLFKWILGKAREFTGYSFDSAESITEINKKYRLGMNRIKKEKERG